jgi:tetratricopeptide (TPR) repeat protein
VPIDHASALRRAEDLLRQGHRDAAIAEYVKIAEFYHQEGFLPKASALYKKILKIKPNDETALLKSGEIAEAQGLVADAKTTFLHLAEQRRRRGDRQAAAHLLVRVGALDPGDVPAQRRAAVALLEIDDRQGAAGVYKDLAFHLLKRNRRIEAVDLLREAAEQEALGPDAAGPLLEKHRRVAAGLASASERPRPDELKTIAALLASLGLDEQALKALGDADAASSPSVAADAAAAVSASASPVPMGDASTPARPPLRVVPRSGRTESVEGRQEPAPREPQGRPGLVEGRAGAADDGPELDLSGELDVPRVEDQLRDETIAESASLFSDLQDLFEELKDEATGRESAEMLARELDLGERYYQAGMIDHAARALQMAARAPNQRFRAAALLGRIELERGRAWEAIRWFERATEAPAPAGEQSLELLYDLANTLESVGERERALAVFIELRMDDPRYRDVAKRVSRLLKR